MSIHEYPLAQRMYGRAQALGADDTAVAIGMANASLALGDTRSARIATGQPAPTMRSARTTMSFWSRRATSTGNSGEIDRALADFVRWPTNWILRTQAPAPRKWNWRKKQGRPIIDRLGMGSEVRVNPVFEDENIYQMDARLLGVQNNASLLPPPRRSIETFADSRFQFRPRFVSSDSRFRRRAQCPGRLLISQRAADSESQYVRHHLQCFRGADGAVRQREAEPSCRDCSTRSGATRFRRCS